MVRKIISNRMIIINFKNNKSSWWCKPSKWYGYEKGENRKPQIISSEAMIIEQIFASYLAGDSMKKIAESLNNKNIITRDSNQWRESTLLRILQNEKYCGNYIYQKTLSRDPLTKEKIMNTGQLPKYLIEGVHDGIVTVQTFNLVQDEIKRRNCTKKVVGGKEKNSRYNSEYALSERLFCGKCGSSMRRKIWKNRDGSSRINWICYNRVKGQKCKAEVIDEYRIHSAIIKALNKYKNEKDAIDDIIKRNMEQAVLTNTTSAYVIKVKNELTVLEKSFSNLIALSIQSRQSEIFEERFGKLSDSIALKREEYERTEKLAESNDSMNETLKMVKEYLDNTPSEITDYDDSLVRQTITRVETLDKNNLKITFIDGTETTERMDNRK